MKNSTTPWFALGIIILTVLMFATLNGTLANSGGENDQVPAIAHPTQGAPTPNNKRYILPWDRRQKALVTNGPGEGDHITNYTCTEGTTCYIGSQEAIDFGARPQGNWNEIRASKQGGVYINAPEISYWTTWGNLLVISHQDNFFTYYAHLAQQSPYINGSYITKGSAIGSMGNSGCRNATPACGIHLHFEARDMMSNQNPYTGDSNFHPLRRVRGIGWYPWPPHASMNSGFTAGSTSHPIGYCVSNTRITVQWPSAPNGEVDDTDANGVTQIEAYSYGFVPNNPDYTPPKDPILNREWSVLTSNPVTPGADPQHPNKYWFHLRVKSRDYGWASAAEVVHQGPYLIANGCPFSAPPDAWQGAQEGDPPE